MIVTREKYFDKNTIWCCTTLFIAKQGDEESREFMVPNWDNWSLRSINPTRFRDYSDLTESLDTNTSNVARRIMLDTRSPNVR